MRNWLFSFKPETYERVKKHNTVGVHKFHHKRFSLIAPNDRFIIYLSRVQVLDGHGFVSGQPYSSSEPIFGEGVEYPCRCKVNFGSTGMGRPAKDTLWFLEEFRDQKTHPANVLFCRGGFSEVGNNDFEYLERVLAGTESPARLCWT